MFLNCKDVARSIASDQLAEDGWWHRLAVKIHLRFCRKCQSYREQLLELGSAARQLWTRSEDATTVSRLEDLILKDATRHPPDDHDQKDRNERQ